MTAFKWNLPTDATILRSVLDLPNHKGGLVLCEWRNGPCNYVTWRVDMLGSPYLGHYFTDVDTAITDYRNRDAEIWG